MSGKGRFPPANYDNNRLGNRKHISQLISSSRKIILSDETVLKVPK